jgi:tetratricopeptide (TPR) repeat protein
MTHSSATSRQLLGQALALHQAGKRPQAEAIYRQMLSANPRDANALRLLGVLQFESGQTAAALELISRAIAISPNVADYHFSLAGILQAIGQHDGATASYRRAVEIYPKFPQAWFNLGNLLRARQQNTQAIAAYRQALAAQPNYPEAANNLGIALAAAGQHQAAIDAYRQALASRPVFPEAANNMAESLDAVGQFDEAIAACQEALKTRPNFAEAFAHLGNTFMHKDDAQQAIVAYRRALSLRPDLADVHRNLGDALRETDQLDEAIAAYKHAIKLRPKFPEAYLNLGNALSEKGQADQAIDEYRQAGALRSNFLAAEQNLGLALSKKGCHSEALTAFARVVALTPADSGAHTNLGHALRETGHIDAAIGAYRQAIAIDPNSPLAYSNLAATLWKIGQYQEALADITKAIALRPTFVEAYINLGFIMNGLGRFDESIDAFRHALTITDSPLAHFNLGFGLLLRGELEPGWREYEWRTQCPEVNPTMRQVPGPAWDGSDLSGKTILLLDEQGLGDAIQFIRYVRLVAERRPARIILECQSPLARLLRTTQNVEQVISRGQTPPAYDVHCSLLSLPLVFNTTLETIPTSTAYLQAEEQLAGDWQISLDAEITKIPGAAKAIKVGLVWGGNTKPNPDRTVGLAALAPLAAVPGVVFVSLQKGPHAQEAKNPPPGMRLIDLTDKISDFVDTAALINGLDLVITIDTSVAHLAGAMGKPLWILVPFSPDWRWLRDRKDCPWYPSARLFRQSALGDWPSAINNLAEELHRLVVGKNPDDAEAQYQLGVRLGRTGKYEQAVAALTCATTLNPDHADAQNSLGIALIEAGRPAEAVAACQRAVARCPTAAKAYCNLAAALAKDNQLDAALDAARKAAELEPNFVGAWVNVGLCFSYLGQLDEAVAAYRRALAIESFPLAHWDLACALLALGDFQEGFREYEWRVAAKQIPQRQFSQPRWQGGPIPAGLSRPPRIFITQEQGLGDAIQFARFIPQVAELGAQVIVECELGLARLFRTIPGVQAVASPGQRMPDFDTHCPLPSLPLALGTTLQNLPAKVPYLRVEPALIADWQRRLEDAMGGSAIAKAGRKIGLVWAGNAKPDPARTTGLSAFAPLAGVRGVSFVSLQLGPGSEEASNSPAGMRLIDPTSQIDDLADTAALISQLDLVITIDSAVAHLAGALGKPVWVFLPFCPDWRWMRDRDDSPWYPTARLFRQTKPGDWGDPVARAAALLQQKSSAGR